MTRNFFFLLSVGVLLWSCGDKTPETQKTPPPAKSLLPQTLWSEASIEGAQPVAKIRSDAKVGEEVVIEGRVRTFVDQRASFQVIDLSLKSCKENPEETCKTPWDYCCVDDQERAENIINVQVPGSDGRLIPTSFQGFHGLDHLQHVIVRGKIASRDDQGNVILTPTAIHRP